VYIVLIPGFTNLRDVMDLAEDYIKSSLNYVLEHNILDLTFLQNNYEKDLISFLKGIISVEFKRITYTEAIDQLITAESKSKKNIFKSKVVWGINLSDEHEKYLTDIIHKSPLIIYNFPNRVKSFYMRKNEDNETVSAMDILLPKVGEIVGGSQREERYEILKLNIEKAFGEDSYKYNKYLDLRKFGTVPHSGFGLGFDRLVMIATGMNDIKDAIPYPRYPNHSEF
jgi:asparaginyl-tRNA synthetase